MIRLGLRTVLPLLLVFLVAGCGELSVEPAGPSADEIAAKDLDRLVSWMAGSFSSANQAAADPEYLPISLVMAPIWKDRDDGRWLYVEQALVGRDPYRQRVYRVTASADGVFESRVYELPDPKAAIGVWKEDAPLAALTPDDLVDREGCAVFLKAKGETSFAGSTKDDACKSDFQGATYATSQVEVFEDRVVSWDRGFDAEAEHVWGAVKGGYVFDKTSSFPSDKAPEPD